MRMNWWTPSSLRLRLVVFVAGPVLVISLLAGMAVLRGLETQLSRQLRDEVQLVARSIRLPLSHALELGRSGSLNQAMISALEINRIYGVYVYDEHGEIVTGIGSREADPDSSRIAELMEDGEQKGEFNSREAPSVYSYFVPLTDSGGRISGLLQLTRRSSDFQSYLIQLRYAGLAVLAGVIALVVLVLTLGYRMSIGKPLDTLLTAMAGIERSGGTRVPLVGPSEIRRLGNGINSMLRSIAESEAELERQRWAQQDLERRLFQSEKLAAIGQFAAGVAHELNTPLSVVSGEAQRFARRGMRGRSFDRIHDAASKMQRILSQLIGFGREDRLRFRTVPALRIAEVACGGLAEEAERNGTRLECMGPTPSPRVRVDPFRINQALSNLLRNAIQAAPEGTVRLTWYCDSGRVGFLIDDDGPGIAPEMVNRIFEPFFTTKAVSDGTGLGLSVVQSVATEHEASLSLEKSPTGGARFRLVFAGRQSGPALRDPS